MENGLLISRLEISSFSCLRPPFLPDICNRIKEPHKTHPYFSFHLSISHARRVYNEQLTTGWTQIESGNCDGLEYMDLYR